MSNIKRTINIYMKNEQKIKYSLNIYMKNE